MGTRDKAFVDALIAELVGTVSALTGQPAAAGPGSPTEGPAWVVRMQAAGAANGSARLSVDVPGAERLARTVLGPEAQLTPTTVTGLLGEIMAQVAQSIGQQPSFAGAHVTIEGIDAGEALKTPLGVVAVSLGDQGRLSLAVSATLESGGATLGPAGPPAVVKPAPGLKDLAPGPVSNWDVVLDIDLPLRVRFGSTEMSIRALSALGPGSIVDMGRSPDDPVELLVCGRVIARAEVVVVEGNYGIRVTDLLSATERLRALEGQW